MTTFIYRPANGTEGAIFEAHFCDRCIHDAEQQCEIHNRAMVFEAGDEEYPHEWCYDEDGRPTCTAFATEIPPPTREELEAAGQQSLLALADK